MHSNSAEPVCSLEVAQNMLLEKGPWISTQINFTDSTLSSHPEQSTVKRLNVGIRHSMAPEMLLTCAKFNCCSTARHHRILRWREGKIQDAPAQGKHVEHCKFLATGSWVSSDFSFCFDVL